MSMRSQVYEWSNLAAGGLGLTSVATLRRSVDAQPQVVPANREFDMFIGGIGNNITKPAETTATQFIVIEDIACSAWLGGALQVRINTTDYFLDPDNVGNDGIPGAASPYPRSINFQPCFNLYPDVYVLPGQVFDALVTFYNSGASGTTVLNSGLLAFMKYTLYDGPDALIANKLLEMGISINPGNVDWYKRTLIQSQSAGPMPTA